MNKQPDADAKPLWPLDKAAPPKKMPTHFLARPCNLQLGDVETIPTDLYFNDRKFIYE